MVEDIELVAWRARGRLPWKPLRCRNKTEAFNIHIYGPQ